MFSHLRSTSSQELELSPCEEEAVVENPTNASQSADRFVDGVGRTYAGIDLRLLLSVSKGCFRGRRTCNLSSSSVMVTRMKHSACLKARSTLFPVSGSGGNIKIRDGVT